MSTRCNIIIKGNATDSITLYHHHDGYPAGVGAILKNFCSKLNESHTNMDCDAIANYLIKNGIGLHNTITDGTITDDEYRVSSSVHGDIEYLYYLYAHPNAKNGAKRYFVIGYEANKYWRRCDGWSKITIPDTICNEQGWETIYK